MIAAVGRAPAPPRPLPWLTLALLLAAALAMLVPGLGPALGWEPGAGPWRLLTCQLAHWDADQLGWDLLAVAMLGGWAELRWPGPTRLTIVLGLAVAPVAVACAYPALAFRGLSGIACALATVGSLCALAESRRLGDRPGAWVASGLLIGVIAKTAWEATTGTTVFASAAGWVPVPLAHAAGIACGVAAAALEGLMKKARRSG